MQPLKWVRVANPFIRLCSMWPPRNRAPLVSVECDIPTSAWAKVLSTERETTFFDLVAVKDKQYSEFYEKINERTTRGQIFGRSFGFGL